MKLIQKGLRRFKAVIFIISGIINELISRFNYTWLAVFLALSGAFLIAINNDYSKFGFILMSIQAFLWIYYGISKKEYSIVTMNCGFQVINFTGIYNWLIIN